MHYNRFVKPYEKRIIPLLLFQIIISLLLFQVLVSNLVSILVRQFYRETLTFKDFL